jgi:hypothetical protein
MPRRAKHNYQAALCSKIPASRRPRNWRLRALSRKAAARREPPAEFTDMGYGFVSDE